MRKYLAREKKVLCHFAFYQLKTKPSSTDKEKEAQIFYWRRNKRDIFPPKVAWEKVVGKKNTWISW